MLTAGGGQHIYYAYAGELKSTTLGEGVDFLAEGRMVIAPGSVRAEASRICSSTAMTCPPWRRCRDRSWRS